MASRGFNSRNRSRMIQTLSSVSSRPARRRYWSPRSAIRAAVLACWSRSSAAWVASVAKCPQGRHVALVAAFQWRQQADAIGQDPVGVLENLSHVEDVGGGLIAMSAPRAPIYLCLRNSASAVAAQCGLRRRVISGLLCLHSAPASARAMVAAAPVPSRRPTAATLARDTDPVSGGITRAHGDQLPRNLTAAFQ
jgi:hypothetical protein